MVLLSTFLAIAAPALGAAERVVLVYGDSLSAAYGLRSDQGWVHLLGERLARERPGWRVVNASLSGETTAGGAARFPRALAQHRPALVVLELGANDGLRGLPLAAARDNLARMIGQAKDAGAQVVLLGMRIPPNYGRAYTTGFHAMYGELAKAHGVPLVPFFLEPIAMQASAFLPDQVHPNAASQPRLLEHVWPTLAAATQSGAQAP